MARILVVDDETRLVTLLAGDLRGRGHDVTGCSSGRDALALVEAEAFDVVLTDLRMAPVDGMQVLSGVRKLRPGAAVILVTAYAEVQGAVEALKQGAYHYLTKPFNLDEVAHVVDQAVAAADLQRENRALRRTVGAVGSGPVLVGESAAMAELRRLIGQVGPTGATVLIRGESGVGKEIAAHAVHVASDRAGGPFVAVNCAALAESLLESELFGYRKGAFTGAERDHAGLFEAARGGSLFLDEIGEAGSSVQAKLLRVLETRRINRVGDPVEREVDVRIIAATNRSLEDAIAAGGFREDLYYRLLVFPLDVPPLRERSEDIPLLVEHFLARLGRREGRLPADALRRLRAHPWPGNVRELRNLIERAHILAGAGPIDDEHVRLDVGARPSAAATPEDLNLDENARKLIRAALRRAGGNKTQAAELLGITRRTLYSRLELLGMQDEV